MIPIKILRAQCEVWAFGGIAWVKTYGQVMDMFNRWRGDDGDRGAAQTCLPHGILPWARSSGYLVLHQHMSRTSLVVGFVASILFECPIRAASIAFASDESSGMPYTSGINAKRGQRWKTLHSGWGLLRSCQLFTCFMPLPGGARMRTVPALAPSDGESSMRLKFEMAAALAARRGGLRASAFFRRRRLLFPLPRAVSKSAHASMRTSKIVGLASGAMCSCIRPIRTVNESANDACGLGGASRID